MIRWIVLFQETVTPAPTLTPLPTLTPAPTLAIFRLDLVTFSSQTGLAVSELIPVALIVFGVILGIGLVALALDTVRKNL